MEIANTTPLAAHCGQCPLKSRCLPGALDQEQTALFKQIVNHNRVLRQGAHAFTAGEQFHAIYMVRAGAVKTYCLTEEGEEQVTGFYSVGDCFGFDGIHTQRHSNAAKALTRSQLCEIPFDSLEKLCTRIPHLQHHTFQLISQQIQEEQKRMYLMGKCSAIASGPRYNTDGIGLFNPLFGGQNKTIYACLPSKPLEFEGFKIWIIQLLPNT